VLDDDRVFDGQLGGAGQDRVRGGRREALRGGGFDEVNPPVLRAAGRGADVGAPGAVGGDREGGALERLRAERILAERRNGVEM